MRATPRRSLAQRAIVDLYFELRSMTVQIFPIVCDPKPGLFSLDLQSMGQANIAKLEMVSIGLTVGGNVNQFSGLPHPDEAIDEALARTQGALKRDTAREWTMIEKYRQRSAGTVRMQEAISTSGINASRTDILPGRFAVHPDALSLVRRHDYKAQSTID